MRLDTTHTTNSLNAFSRYRFHFNGKESDNEVYGEGNVYDYGFRIYNPRLGKFLSVDPLTKSYPWYTPYQFAGNKPINCVDLDGLEEKPVNPSTSPTDPNLAALNLLVGTISQELNNLWNNSFKVGVNGREVEEWSLTIFNQQQQSQSISTGVIKVVNKYIVANVHTDGNPDHVNVDFTPPTLGNLQLVGDAHTHPYKSSMYEGMPPSFDDVVTMKSSASKQGYVSIVEAGNQRFALVITDALKAQSFFDNNTPKSLKKLYEEGEKQYKGTNQQEAVKSGLLNLLKDSGITLYQTKDDKKVEFEKLEIQKEAKLEDEN